MPWQSQATYSWAQWHIDANAPDQPGVYGIFNAQYWIYIGRAENVRWRLREHMAGDNACIARYAPIGFKFDVIPLSGLESAEKALILEFQPVCNQRVG